MSEANDKASPIDGLVMTDLMHLVKGFTEAGIPTTLRVNGEYQYLFVGEPEDAKCLYGMDDNFETTDLDTLLVRHKYFEFENGATASWSAS